MEYYQFLEKKAQLGGMHGFAPIFMPEFLFDFQRALVEWSLMKGRSAIFADCGLGKTPMQLVWSENVVRKTNKPVIIATPLAVSAQLISEAHKFNICAERSRDGSFSNGAKIIVTNYERLEKFDPSMFSGMVCDESSILKNFDGARKTIVTEFMKKLPYRLLCTATAAPNDYIELGTSSEALGELGHTDMLARFFKNDNNTSNSRIAWRTQGGKERNSWRFRGHAEDHFWRWVCSWARAVRRPSDLGFSDDKFTLPKLTENEHIVKASKTRAGFLFDLPAQNFFEEREERRRSIEERCEKVSHLVEHYDQSLVWCHLNPEGDMLKMIIQDSEQVSGRDSDERKEELLMAFQSGQLKRLITKPKIGAWGLNFQKCAHTTFFPSHSYEQYYQGVRRLWRFGQTRPVTVDIVASEGESGVTKNLHRKADQADKMFSLLVQNMNNSYSIEKTQNYTQKVSLPSWL